LDIRFDLSDVLFIATANVLDTIPAPLLDRMEVLRLSGYIEDEKIEIAKRYLLPKQRKKHGISGSHLRISKSGYQGIIQNYAKEAGVRNLEKEIANLCRKVATKIAREEDISESITSKNVENYLGKPKYSKEIYQKILPAGVVMGLAWTSIGGATLYIESNSIKSKPNGFKQTGQLGKVMIESSNIAYSYIQANLSKFGINKNFFQEHFIHLHVPAGATPKDGPSAGITMALSLVSLALNKPVAKNIAMTGELTLTGQVLPIGGLKEKVIAAKQAKVKTVIIPEENKKDYDDIPDNIKEGLNFEFVSNFEKVFKIAFNKRR